MKAKLIFWVVLLSSIFYACNRVAETFSIQALEVDLKIEQNQLLPDVPNKLFFTIENTSTKPVEFLGEMLVLEFTSYSGSIKRNVPVASLLELPENPRMKNDAIALNAGDHIELSIDLSNLIFTAAKTSIPILPANEYTVNAFLKSSDNSSVEVYSAIRHSNYVDVIIRYEQNNLSSIN